MPLTEEELEKLDRENPVIAARYRNANNLPHASQGTITDGRARAHAMREMLHRVESGRVDETPEADAPPEADPIRRRYVELRKTNPVIAARFALANNLFHNSK